MNLSGALGISLSMSLFLVSGSVQAAQTRWQSSSPGPTADSKQERCVESATGDPALEEVLRALVFRLADEKKPLSSVRLTGLRTLNEAALWETIGGQPATWDPARAALALRRLVSLGLFSQIAPVVEIGQAEGPTLVVNLVENPLITKVVFEGLGELEPESLLDELLTSPSPEDVERRRVRSSASVAAAIRQAVDDTDDHEDEEEDEAKDEGEDKESEKSRQTWRKLQRMFEDPPRRRGRCADPLPPREWLARAEGETVFPGIVWKGLVPALDRVQHRIFRRGYELSRLEAELAADGTLSIRIDEGRVSRLEIRGVAPRLEPQVRSLLGIQPGRAFVESDLHQGLRRIERTFPFLRPDRRDLPSRAEPQVEELSATDGARRYVSRERPPSSEHRWFTVSDGTIVLHLKARRGSSDTHFQELLRHTPVTGFAPGLDTVGRLWDSENRAHLVVDLGGNVNTARAAEAAPGTERWRFDGRAGARVQIPDLKVAELGVEAYSAVDTSDRWRMAAIDSYIYSMLINRPDSTYFRREGLTAMLTFHLLERLTAGVEYRRDRYQSLTSAADVFTFFRRAEPPSTTPPITNGQMGSLLVRVEYSTHAVPLHGVGGRRRDAERSIVGSGGKYFWTELRTVNTVEIADPELGGDDAFKFVRVVSDNAVFLDTGGDTGIKLRGRAAGQLGEGALPLQKREALGGWSALRGYGFQELAGDFSLLATAEYRLGGVSAFIDAGSVRSGGEFSDPRAGLGATLNLGDEARLDVAWRTDSEARLRPEFRLLFERTF